MIAHFVVTHIYGNGLLYIMAVQNTWTNKIISQEQALGQNQQIASLDKALKDARAGR
jgi:hypothetical protein